MIGIRPIWGHAYGARGTTVPRARTEDYMDIMEFDDGFKIIIDTPRLYEKEEIKIDHVGGVGGGYIMLSAPGYRRKIQVLRADVRSVRDIVWSYKNRIVEINLKKKVLVPKVVVQENAEDYVRKSLKSIILSLLRQDPMSGYDIVRTISQRFRVRLSPSTVYPFLYSLREERILKTEMYQNEKVYAPVEYTVR